MTLVAACVQNVHNLRTEKKFCDILDEVVAQTDAHSRQTQRDNTLIQDYVVKETTEGSAQGNWDPREGQQPFRPNPNRFGDRTTTLRRL